MSTRSELRWSAVLLVLVAAVSFSAAAYADSPPGASNGDAQAVFQATFTGAQAIRNHNADANGAPFQYRDPPPDTVHISPAVDGASYCAAGWHVISFGLGESLNDFPTRQALVDDLVASSIQFSLDGVALPTDRTTIKSAQDGAFGPDTNLLFVNFGVLLEPGTPSLGTHTLASTISEPGFPTFNEAVQFTMIAC
jgi:hypothetical protein